MFENRFEAGIKLAEKIKVNGSSLVLAIPRGGVEVGVKVAEKLNAPLDVIVARKLGAPGNPELAIGAVTSEGTLYLDEKLIQDLGVDVGYIERTLEAEKKEAQRREEKFRAGRKKPRIDGKNVYIVDDGIATGATIRAIIQQISGEAKTVTLAVPVLPMQLVNELGSGVDELVYLVAPENFYAVGLYYKNFPQVSDDEVIKLLSQSEKQTDNSGG